MKRKQECIESRKEFIIKSICNPGNGANELRDLAKRLETCKTTMQVTRILQKVLCVSESTIFKDIKKS